MNNQLNKVINTLKLYANAMLVNGIGAYKSPFPNIKDLVDYKAPTKNIEIPLIGFVPVADNTIEAVGPLWKATVISPGTIKLEPTEVGGHILFENLQPRKSIKTITHKAILSNSKTSDISTKQYTNETGSTESTRITYSVTKGKSSQTDVGGSLTLSISESLTAGGAAYPLTSTTDISASATANFNKSNGISKSTTSSSEIDLTIAPRSITNLTTHRSVDDYTQELNFLCNFDAKITFTAGFYTAGEIKYEASHCTFTNIEEIETVLEGYGNPESSEYGFWLNNDFDKRFINAAHLNNFKKAINGNPVNYTQHVKFNNSSSGQITISETDLNGNPFAYGGEDTNTTPQPTVTTETN